MKNNKGVTLVELLIVVAIIGILAAVGIPAYVGMQTRGAVTEGSAKVEELRLLQEQYYSENGQYAPPNPPNNGTRISDYKATPGNPGDNGIEDFLPGFQPGGCTGCAKPFGLQFEYRIESEDTIDDGLDLADRYVITATGAGCKVDSSVVIKKDWQGN